MQSSVLTFVLVVMVLAMLFFSFAASRFTGQAWPFCVLGSAAALGLGLTADRARER